MPTDTELHNAYAARLAETLPRVRDDIARAADEVGRDPADVRLVAVTKSHPLACLEAAVAAGLTDLGENRVGELEEKVAAVGSDEIRWHMIGRVQRRKAPRLLGLAHLIHSVDSMRLAERFQRVVEGSDEVNHVDILVQVNTSGEDAKSGFSRSRAGDAVLEIAELPGLRVHGLMTMAPFVDDEKVLRTTFRRLREVRDDARAANPEVGHHLSMGMTNDLRYAVEEGSTMVRIGTALFGERPGHDAD